MGGEIKSILEGHFDAVFSAGEIRNLTIGKILELQGGGSAPSSAPAKNGTDNDAAQQVNTICARLDALISLTRVSKF